MLEFIRQADAYGIDIVISFDIENANADQLERTMNDLEMIDATVENEPCRFEYEVDNRIADRLEKGFV